MKNKIFKYSVISLLILLSVSCIETQLEKYVGPIDYGDQHYSNIPVSEGVKLESENIDTSKLGVILGDPTDPEMLDALRESRKRIIEQAIDDMVFVDGGTFLMGATKEQGSDVHIYEKNVRKVTLDSFYISKFLVTQELYWVVMGGVNQGSFTKEDNLNYPIDGRFYSEIETFINKLNTITNMHFALPTEAQWEFAARGGRKRIATRYAGSNNIDDVAIYWTNSMQVLSDTTMRYPLPVGSLQANELGLYDMSGNMAEVCRDWYAPYNEDELLNPKGPIDLDDSELKKKVCRGGGFSTIEKACRISARSSMLLTSRYNYISFRLVHPAVE